MRRTEFFVVDGVKYAVKAPEPRPTEKQLMKNGIIVTLDFDNNFEWLKKVTEKWAARPELQHPTVDRINALYIKMVVGDILVKVTRLDPASKQTYCLDCYNMDDKSCDMQILANIAGAQARYIITWSKGGNTKAGRMQVMTAAQVLSAILLGAQVYINITNYRVFDVYTMTEGPRNTEILPIHCFGKDILLDE